MAEKNCDHSGCHCKIQEEKAVSRGSQIYCSDHCANARTSSGQGDCNCGHSGCGK